MRRYSYWGIIKSSTELTTKGTIKNLTRKIKRKKNEFAFFPLNFPQLAIPYFSLPTFFFRYNFRWNWEIDAKKVIFTTKIPNSILINFYNVHSKSLPPYLEAIENTIFINSFKNKGENVEKNPLYTRRIWKAKKYASQVQVLNILSDEMFTSVPGKRKWFFIFFNFKVARKYFTDILL